MSYNKFTLAIVFKVLVATAVIVLLVSLVDPKALSLILGSISLPVFALVVLIMLLDTVFMGLKWNILLDTFRVSVSNYGTVMAYLRSRIFAFIAPSTLGVDVYKIYFLRKNYGSPISSVTSSIVIERILGLLSSLGIASLLAWYALAPFDFEHKDLLTGIGLLGFVALLLFINFIIRYSHRLAMIPIPPFVPERLAGLLALLFSDFQKIESKERRLWLYFFLSMLEKLGYGSAIYFSALAIGLNNLSFTFIIAATPILALIEKLPISISTLGIREGLIVLLLSPFYADATAPIAIALTLRCAEMAQIILFSFIWLFKHGYGGYQQELDAIAREAPQSKL